MRNVYSVVSISATLECNSLAFGWLGLHSGSGQPVLHDFKHSLAAAKFTSQQACVIGILQEVEAHIRGEKTATKFETTLHQAIDKSIKDTDGQWVTLKHSNLHGKGGSGPRGCKDRWCEDGVQITNQLNKVGVDLVVIEGISYQLMGNGSISIP